MPTKAMKPKKGRPPAVAPEQLLDAAAPLFADRGFDGTSTREIAKRAKCNVAMIAYHFGNKEGLYRALLSRYVRRVHDQFTPPEAHDEEMSAELVRRWPELPAHEQRAFCNSLFEAGCTIILSECAHRIFSHEMMAGGKRLVELLAKNDGGIVGPMRELIERLRASSKLRTDFDWRYAVISIIGPLVYSNIATPVLRGIYRFEHIDEGYVRGLCVHLTRMFFDGLAKKEWMQIERNR